MIAVHPIWMKFDKMDDYAMDKFNKEHKKNISGTTTDKDQGCKAISHY
jgi:hypothetical protein